MRRASNASVETDSRMIPTANGVDGESPSHTVANGDGGHDKVVPGRATRKRRTQSSRKSSHSFFHRCYVRWFQGLGNIFGSLFLAVFLWYILGVISIATSKILLTKSSEGRTIGGVSPLYLTFQQLLIGSTLLKFLLSMRFMGSAGVVPWASLSSATSSAPKRLYGVPAPKTASKMFNIGSYQPSLVLAGVTFTFGFLTTNSGFAGSSASFVETIKAAEPITSAVVAVSWGIEVLSKEEMMSLGTIVAGVLFSTFGHGSASSQEPDSGLWASVQACVIVMIANLCFSFRGLYQKWFRASPEGSSSVVDDLNLQYRMQQIGVGILLFPVLILDGPSILTCLRKLLTRDGLFSNGTLLRYLALSLLNGCAFTSYNLASTFVLSRISVVHHAALNCVRRIFAIVVTSLFFAVPITFVGAVGICITVFGFLRFTHYKVQRQKQPKPVSSLLPVSATNK